jgi:hypothetical protein
MTASRAAKNTIIIRGIDGADGDDGKGISSASYNASTGVLTITFTDNSTYQTGDLRGTKGDTGKGIASTSYNSGTGVLTITFTDASTYNTGDIRGAAGKGISSTSYNSGTGVLTITFSDSSTYQTGDIRGVKGDTGDTGAAGKGISSTSYNSGTGVLTITFSDASTYNTEDIRGTAAPTVNVNGIINLIYNDDTDSAEHNTSTSESTARKTYTLAANTYSKIIIEFIVRARVEQSANTKADFTWRIKSAGTTVRTFVQRIIASATTGILSGDRLTETFSYIMAGGQVANTDITITVQNSLNNASTGALVHAVRIYGVMNASQIGKGDTGSDGKGISSTSYNSGTGVLTITFTDASTYNTGDLRGALQDNTFDYAKIYSDLKSKATVTSAIDLSANGQGVITLSANTAFSFSGYQLNKSYMLIVTANGFTPSFAVEAKHIAVEGNAAFGTSGVFYVSLTCIDATSGSEKLLTVIMKGA